MKVMEKGLGHRLPLDNKYSSKIDEAAKGMEKMFLKYLVNELRKSNENIDIFGNKKRDDFFEGELYSEYVEKAVERGDMGIAQMIKDYIKRANNL